MAATLQGDCGAKGGSRSTMVAIRRNGTAEPSGAMAGRGEAWVCPCVEGLQGTWVRQG